jgi:hypothetical protein
MRKNNSQEKNTRLDVNVSSASGIKKTSAKLEENYYDTMVKNFNTRSSLDSKRIYDSLKPNKLNLVPFLDEFKHIGEDSFDLSMQRIKSDSTFSSSESNQSQKSFKQLKVPMRKKMKSLSVIKLETELNSKLHQKLVNQDSIYV